MSAFCWNKILKRTIYNRHCGFCETACRTTVTIPSFLETILYNRLTTCRWFVEMRVKNQKSQKPSFTPLPRTRVAQLVQIAQPVLLLPPLIMGMKDRRSDTKFGFGRNTGTKTKRNRQLRPLVYGTNCPMNRCLIIPIVLLPGWPNFTKFLVKIGSSGRFLRWNREEQKVPNSFGFGPSMATVSHDLLRKSSKIHSTTAGNRAWGLRLKS